MSRHRVLQSGFWMAFAIVNAAALGCEDPAEISGAGPGPEMIAHVAAGNPTVIKRSGDITSGVAEFRILLGEPNNGGGPSAPGGRREINWDGVSGAALNSDAFPGTFFQGRGIVFSTEGNALRVSDNDFADVEPTLGAQMNFFSANRTFAPISARFVDNVFVVPGTGDAATVQGFGVVFSDVDRVGSTSLEIFDAQGMSLGVFTAPARSDATGLSFLGVVYPDARIARVRIRSGDRRLVPGLLDVSAGGMFDLVVMDDFLFAEPVAIDP